MSLNTPSPRNSRREFRGVNPRFTSPVGIPTAPDRRSHAFRGTGNSWRPSNIPPSRGRLPDLPRARTPLPGALGALLKTANFASNVAAFMIPAKAEGPVFPLAWGNPISTAGPCSTPSYMNQGPHLRDAYYHASQITYCVSTVANVSESYFNSTPTIEVTDNQFRWWKWGWRAAEAKYRGQVYYWIKFDASVNRPSTDMPTWQEAQPARVVAVPPTMPQTYHRPAAIAVGAPAGPRNPIIRPGLGFEFVPGAPPRVIEVPTARPPGRTQEGKATGSAAVALGMVVDFFNSTTEVADVLAIFWDNLPKPDNAPFISFYDHMVWMMANPDRWQEVDWDKMIADLIANEIEDQAIGRLHGLKDRLRTEWSEPIYGGAFQGP